MLDKVLKLAFRDYDQVVVAEIIRETKSDWIGGDNDKQLFLSTDKSYIEKKLEENIYAIKEAYYKLEAIEIKEVFVNDKKHELELKELSSKRDIGLIDLNTINIDKTNEMSGENDIVDELFQYETSVLSKTRVTLYLHQREMNKEWKLEINMSIIKNRFSFKRKSLVKRLKQLLTLKYEPTNNDTKEIIQLLKLI